MDIGFPNSKRQPVVKSGGALANTGNTNENTKVTQTIPPLGPNDSIEVIAVSGAAQNDADAKTVRVKLNGTTFATFSLASNLSNRNYCEIQNANSVSAQVGIGSSSSAGFGSSTVATTTGAINTAVETTLTITLQNADGTDTLTLYSYEINVKRA